MTSKFLQRVNSVEWLLADGATGTSLAVKVIDISEDPENDDVSSDSTNVYCVIQNHVFGVKGAGLA